MSKENLDDYDVESLAQNLNEVVNERNRFNGNEYEYGLDTHSKGVAVDIYKSGADIDKVTSQFHTAIMDAGYVVSAVQKSDYDEPHIRLFLREAEEHFDLAPKGPQTAEECVEEITNRFGGEGAHISTDHNAPFIGSYVDDEDIPDGWERDYSDEVAHYHGSVLKRADE